MKAESLIAFLRTVDYIELSNSESNDEPAESTQNGIPADKDSGYLNFPQHPQQHLMRKEVAAFERMHEQLKQTHLGLHVAVHGGEVVDQDEDVTALLERIEQAYPNEVVMIDEVRDRLPPDIVIRSPRLEQI